MKAQDAVIDLTAARESGAEFRAIFDVASVGIVQVDPRNGHLLRFNDKFAEITGYTAEELRARNFPDLTHPDDRANDWEIFCRAARGEAPDYRNEKRYVRKDGSVIWVRLNGAFIRDAAGQAVSTVAVCEDITQRKHTEQALAFLAHCGSKAGEDFFQSLARYIAESLGMDFVCIDRLEGEALSARTVAVFFDGKFEDNLTYTLKETPCGAVVGQAVCCFPSGVRHRFPSDTVLQDMKAESYVGVTLWGYSGKPIGLIAVIGRRPLVDQRPAELLLKLVAGRAAGELERMQSQQILRENQERLQMAQKAGGAGVFDLDFHSGRGFWSEERKRMYGVPLEHEPTRDSWWMLVPAADRAKLLSDLGRVFSARRREWEHVYRIRQPGGQERWLEDRAWFTYDDKGQPARMVGTSIDVTREVEAKTRAHDRQRQFRFSAVRTVLILAVSVFAAEGAIMAVLAEIPSLGPWRSTVIDSFCLVALVSPMLYFFSFRPLVRMLQQREEVEEALRRANETLEARVQDRTAGLELANEKFAAEVVERQKAEAEARRAKEEWERTFDAVPDLIAILDDHHRIVRANRAMAKRLELTPEQCVGLLCYRAVHGAPCPHESCPHDRTLADGAEHTVELSEPRLGGEFLVTTTALKDDSGRMIGAVHVARDITARKRAEKALRENREDLNHAQAVARIGSWRLDLQRNELLCSDETYRIFQIPQGTAFAYETFMAAVHPEDRERVDADWRAALQGKPYDIEHRIVAGGEVKWVHERGVVELDPHGAPLSGFGTIQDITERKQVAAALAQAHANLEQKVQERTAELTAANERLLAEIEARVRKEKDLADAELRYRTVADFTYDWEYWQAPGGKLLYCSPACELITGYSAAELVASPVVLDQIIHPDDREAWKQHACEAMAELAPKGVLFRVQRKGGEVRWVEHKCRPVIGSQGEFLGVRASNRDVTERKLAEMEMQQLRDELARITRITTAGQLSAALAHELNQPLGAIVCNAQAIEQMLVAKTTDFSEVREALRDIEADSKRAGEVIHQLRTLFHRTGQTRAALQLNELLEKTVQLLHSEFVLKGVELRMELDPHLPFTLGNQVELQQVALNLITNALEAMAPCEAGSRRLIISTHRDDSDIVHAAVRDSGAGIPLGELDRVFEPFYTTKSSGMGMGLAICRSILEAHGGRLWAENNPDSGATFHITLPAASARP